MIAIMAIPIVIIEGGPFFLLVLLVGNWELKRKIRFEREHKGVEEPWGRTVIIGTLIVFAIFNLLLGLGFISSKKRKRMGSHCTKLL